MNKVLLGLGISLFVLGLIGILTSAGFPKLSELLEKLIEAFPEDGQSKDIGMKGVKAVRILEYASLIILLIGVIFLVASFFIS